MKAVEVAVFVVVALIVGAVFMSFITDIPYLSFGKYMKSTLLREKTFEFQSVDQPGFYEEVLAFWEANKFSDTDETMRLHLTSSGVLDKESFFKLILENNLCGTIQSKAYGCGEREDVVLDYITLPAIIEVRYHNEKLNITPAESALRGNRTIQVVNIDFGGFEGNGVLVRNLSGIPQSANILDIRLEIIAGGDFRVYFNDQPCKGIFTTSGDIDSWDLTSCKNLIADPTRIRISFLSGDLFRKHIAGGRLRVLYESRIQPAQTHVMELPAIDGAVNYFNGVYFPGPPTSMNINLAYSVGELNGSDFYVNIGNTTVYRDIVSNHIWSGVIPVPLSALRQGMNPLRIGIDSKGVNMRQIDVPQPIDAVLISDVSGSMAWRLDQDDVNGALRVCTDPMIYDPSTAKVSLAKCLAREFSNIIIDRLQENRVGLVSFSTNTYFQQIANLTSDKYELETKINMYVADGWTCIGCGIRDATKLLQGSDRYRAMVVMTDGVANWCPQGATGSYDCADSQALSDALALAQTAFDQGIHIYAIAFGISADENFMHELACIDNCSNYGQSSNASELQEIYRRFADQIASKRAVHTRYVQGARDLRPIPSKLLSGSIDYQYTPLPPLPENSIKLHVRKDADCQGSFMLPQGLTIEDSEILSWAGTFWTESVNVNGQNLYDVTEFKPPYMVRGDPFVFPIPRGILQPFNSYTVRMTDYSGGNEQCFETSVYYTASMGLAPEMKHAVGCRWMVRFPSGVRDITIPLDYHGDRECAYVPGKVLYRLDDSFQHAAGKLFEALDPEHDGIVNDEMSEVYITGGI